MGPFKPDPKGCWALPVAHGVGPPTSKNVKVATIQLHTSKSHSNQ